MSDLPARPTASSAGTGTGAAIAIGAGEGFLMLKTSQVTLAGLLPTSLWVEVDLRRPLGQLLRSQPRPAGASHVEFDLRELLYIADGSLQQRRLAAALHPQAPPHVAHVGFAVYCTATRRAHYPSLRRDKAKTRRTRRTGGGGTATGGGGTAEGAKGEEAMEGAQAAGADGGKEEVGDEERSDDDDNNDEEEDGEGEGGASGAARADGAGDGPGRYLLGKCSVNLRQMLAEGFEPLTEPLDLVDDDGSPAGMLSVTLLAKDALGRARRSALRGPGTVELWVGAETLLVAPTLRAALSHAALWVEIHLESAHLPTASAPPRHDGGGASASGREPPQPVLQVASKRVRMPRGPAAQVGGLASSLAMALRGCLSLPAGSPARSGLQRALKRGSSGDAALGFYLFSSTADAAPPSERRPLASCHVPLVELLAKASHGGQAADGLPLPVQLKNARGDLLATLSADVDGLGALRALAADGPGMAAGGAYGRQLGLAAPSHNDPEALKRLLATRRSEAASKVAALVGNASPA